MVIFVLATFFIAMTIVLSLWIGSVFGLRRDDDEEWDEEHHIPPHGGLRHR